MRTGENIYHRKDGRWEGRYVKGRDEDGRARYAYIYGRTYQEVKEKRNRCMAERKNQTGTVCRLTANILSGFVNDKLECGRLDGKGGLPPKTVRA